MIWCSHYLEKLLHQATRKTSLCRPQPPQVNPGNLHDHNYYTCLSRNSRYTKLKTNISKIFYILVWSTGHKYFELECFKLLIRIYLLHIKCSRFRWFGNVVHLHNIHHWNKSSHIFLLNWEVCHHLQLLRLCRFCKNQGKLWQIQFKSLPLTFSLRIMLYKMLHNLYKVYAYVPAAIG